MSNRWSNVFDYTFLVFAGIELVLGHPIEALLLASSAAWSLGWFERSE